MKISTVLLFISLFSTFHASCLPKEDGITNTLRETNETILITPKHHPDNNEESESKTEEIKDENDEKPSEQDGEDEEKKLGDSEVEEQEDELDELKQVEEEQPNITEVERHEEVDDGNKTENNLILGTDNIDNNTVDEFQLVTACSGELGEAIFLDDNSLDDSEVISED